MSKNSTAIIGKTRLYLAAELIVKLNVEFREDDCSVHSDHASKNLV